MIYVRSTSQLGTNERQLTKNGWPAYLASSRVVMHLSVFFASPLTLESISMAMERRVRGAGHSSHRGSISRTPKFEELLDN